MAALVVVVRGLLDANRRGERVVEAAELRVGVGRDLMEDESRLLRHALDAGERGERLAGAQLADESVAKSRRDSASPGSAAIAAASTDSALAASVPATAPA